MKREITFETALFESVEIGEHFINDRCFGEDLAAWIVEKIGGDGFELIEPYQEDWGWAVEASYEKERFYIAVGIMDESIGDEQAMWLVTIEIVRKWFSFGKPDETRLQELFERLVRVLKATPDITEVTIGE